MARKHVHISIISIFTFIGAIATVSGHMYTDPASLPIKTYDYIIIGAGIGGSVIANRLTEDTNVNVLVIEAGISNEDEVLTRIPFVAPQLSPYTPYTWNYTTIPQKACNNRTMPFPRGRILGGSSSINFMMHTRGSVDDFDRIACATMDESWSWTSLFPYFLKSEMLVPPADEHDTAGQVDPALHGHLGSLFVSLSGYSFPGFDGRVVKTTKELELEFPFNTDMNSGYPLGIGYTQSTIGSGERSSAATAYLEPALERPNLDILIHTTVTNIVQTGIAGHLPILRGVRCATDPSASPVSFEASREVILSAGAIGTPHILLLSGIGNSTEIGALGIEPLLDIPDVGRNLVDHPIISFSYLVNSTATFDDLRFPGVAAEYLTQWQDTKTGLYVDGPGNLLAWLRIPDDSPIFNLHFDPSAGPHSPHFEFIFTNGFVSFTEPSPPNGSYMTIFVALASPSSRGAVTLENADPFSAPRIDPAFLETDFDIHAMRAAVQSAKRFVNSSAWADYIIAPHGAWAEVTTDDEFDQYIRDRTASEWHPVGTAAMSACDTGAGVVSPNLSVKGAVGLRIVDASIFPFLPAAHVQASLYAIAERAADIIKYDYA
ncbi:GMC oxidoreductase [Neolentinus lepideus HHB14362 ss-1]|uniref:GMC oxidoreductase n=1 Tax=Neolentinus lepideus HHB14362 ss-1 TaxID=1314782 RepID=A0A165SYE4_9AGAM|nr:GMC oxidoreductase [Neolentinus lepideus HHB14362 ss-1]